MKIYFAGSIRGGREDVDLYTKIVKHLQTHGKVISEHVGDKGLSVMGEDGPNDQQIHDRDLAWVLEADVIVAEVTTPSLGVGYEIGRAIEHGKPVLALYRHQTDRVLSAMVAGSPDVNVAEYWNIEGAMAIIDNYFKNYLRTS